ncbi:MAG: hypothetical protein A3J49_01960 [Gallionellales bacterium RIFCSPHIGHO2_02_FULL_57_16]|nr:MAG: hypothetical protein A3J49_01960 [Gallionellales bacterium RIFCSPHIGHO2_02_FULL_57_16]
MPVIQNPDDLPMRGRSIVVALVVLAHVSLIWFYTSSFISPRSAPREMSISMAFPQTAAVEPKPQQQPKPVKTEPVSQAAAPDIPVETPAPPVESSTAQPQNTAPTQTDREPDYRASYLKNPLPVYPMVARRMGWQGKVVLNVEVLENGLPGQIKLHQSSGRDVLDNAAIQAVRGWRFVAARQNGQMVAKWFLVPIPFILKESE